MDVLADQKSAAFECAQLRLAQVVRAIDHAAVHRRRDHVELLARAGDAACRVIDRPLQRPDQAVDEDEFARPVRRVAQIVIHELAPGHEQFAQTHRIRHVAVLVEHDARNLDRIAGAADTVFAVLIDGIRQPDKMFRIVHKCHFATRSSGPVPHPCGRPVWHSFTFL